ncbi:uncharacterized protein LOC123548871 [Mercenaria mercenaria]|uniref:uncharacterized protein LOC123548871 n=1 Tax=Mercenaria mercenaria TaxID=6596 RepID=UPI00234EE931|nr:uncharacterized protein LOC123548871 [Mercenaria mercenaria]
MNHQHHIRKPLYRNWVKGGLAYKYLKDGIENFADEAVQQEHTRLLQLVKYNPRNVCTCSLQTLKPKHGRVKDRRTGKAQCQWSQTRCNCLFANTQACPENICDEMFDEILRCHGSTPPAPNWKNTHLSDWCSNSWEVAKCFINAPGYLDKKTASDIDITGLLHVFINNKMLHSHLACHINGSDVFYKALRGRNKIFHSSSMELMKNELIEITDGIKALLEDQKELKAKLDSQKAVKNLEQLMRDDICITTQNEAEVFREAMNSINKRTEELNELIRNTTLDIKSQSENASNTLDEKAQQIFDGPLQSLEKKYDQLCKKVKHLEIDTTKIKIDLSLMRKRLDELESLEHARLTQQQNLEYITQKQELQSLLIALYQKDQVKTWVSPLITRENNTNISEVYVPPKMFIQGTPERLPESDIEERHVQSYHEIFCATEDETNENSGENQLGSKPFQIRHGQLKNIYILGEVGAGKSAFCKMMIHTWCNAMSDNSSSEHINKDENSDINLHELSRYEFLFYVPMCYTPGNVADLQSMVRHTLRGKENDRRITIDRLIEDLFIRESERCLIIIDGLDEWTPPAPRGHFPRHAAHGLPISGNVQNATIITTSRPSALGILNMKYTEYDRKINLVGIDKSEIKLMTLRYMKKAIHKGLDVATTTENFIQELKASNFPHPEKTPLLLQQVLWMYCNGRKIDRSVSDIYTNIVNIIFAWFEEKEPGQEDLKHVPEDVKHLRLPMCLSGLGRYVKNEVLVWMLGKLAFRTIASATPSLMFGFAILKECDVPKYILLRSLSCGLIVQQNCPDPVVEKTNFSFTHISFRDFFVAVYILSHHQKYEIQPKSREAILHKLFKRNARRGTWGLPPPLKAGKSPYDLSCVGATLNPKKKKKKKKIERCSAMENVLQLSNILTMICGLDPVLITDISKEINKKVLKDGQRNEYIMKLEDGQNVEPDLMEQTNKIQQLSSNLLSECLFPNSEELPEIRVCDIIIQEDINLNLVRHILPEAVQSLYIDRHCLNDDVMEVIAMLNRIQTLAIKNKENVKYGQKVSPELTKADSLVQLILCNEDLSIDLSSHEKLRNVALDKCKLISISRDEDTTFLSSIRIRGLFFPHEHFKLLSSSFAQAVVLEDLTLEDISCDRSGCKGHQIDLPGSEKLHAFTLGDCNYLGVNISSSCKLESCGLRRCRLSHAQFKELSTNLTQVVSLKKLEVDNLHCDDVKCEGHSIDLSAQQHFDTLCLQNCVHISVIGVVGNEAASCIIRHCRFSHEQCSEISSLLTQSISLRILELCRIECSKSTCSGHKVDLLKYKYLQSVHVWDKCIYPYRLSTASLERLDFYISKHGSELPGGMMNATVLRELKVEALSSKAFYTKQMNSLTQTFKRLQRFKLGNVNIAALSVSPDMENLNFIELWVVTMTQSIWCDFVDSLIKLKQSVTVRTKSMDVISKSYATTAVGYVKSRSANFEVIPEPEWEFSFKLKR